MSRKRKRKSGAPTQPPAREAGAQRAKRGAGSTAPEEGAPLQEYQITQYIFTFELIRQYPTIRSFIVKQPLKRSFGDTVSDFFGGNKKGVYRI